MSSMTADTAGAWPLRRSAAVAAYVAFVLAWVLAVGLPADPIEIGLLLWLGTSAWRTGRGWREHVTFARDWAGPVLFLLLYAYSYGFIYKLGLPVHYSTPIRFDSWIGGGLTPSQRLQRWLCHGSCSSTGGTPFDALLSLVYLSHFVTAWLLAAVLWVRDRNSFLPWIRRFVTLNLLGLLGYVAFPMAPPWMASEHGYLTPAVTAAAGRGLPGAGVTVSRVLHGAAYANPVAAMPSLHAATATLVALWGVQRLATRARWLVLLYPLAMCTALLYFGEHYVLDELAGVALAIAVHVAYSALERRAARSSRLPAQDTRRLHAGH